MPSALALSWPHKVTIANYSQSAYARSTMANEATDNEQAAQESIQDATLASLDDTLDKALRGEMAIDEAAATLTDPSRWSDIPLDDYAYLLFGVCLDKALKVESQHPNQRRLVTLLDSLQERPAPAGEQGEYWASLPTIFTQVAELLNTEGLLESPGDRLPWQRRMTVSEWRNLHGFLATYYTNLPEGEQASFGYYHQALLLLRHVLETPRKTQTLNENLPAIAAWISTAGSQLHGLCQREQALLPRDTTRLRYVDEQELYAGPDNWNMDRWAFWRGRLEDLGRDESLTPEGREAALLALKEMRQTKQTRA